MWKPTTDGIKLIKWDGRSRQPRIPLHSAFPCRYTSSSEPPGATGHRASCSKHCRAHLVPTFQGQATETSQGCPYLYLTQRTLHAVGGLRVPAYLLEARNPSRCQSCIFQQRDSQHLGSLKHMCLSQGSGHAGQGRDLQEPESSSENPVGSCWGRRSPTLKGC